MRADCCEADWEVETVFFGKKMGTGFYGDESGERRGQTNEREFATIGFTLVMLSS